MQISGHEARVVPRFEAGAGADLLLVTNHRTTPEVVDAWREVGALLGLRTAVWDVSLEGHLRLGAAEGAAGPLLAELAGGVVLILDHLTETPDGLAYPHDHLARADVQEALRRGTGLLLYGKGVDLEPLLLPAAPPGEEAAPATDAEALVEGVPARLPAERAPAPLGVLGRLEVRTGWWVWGTPAAAELVEEATALQERLRTRFPGERLVVVHDFRPEVVDRALFLKRWRLGTLEVRGTARAAAPALVRREVSEEELESPLDVLERGLPALLLALGFEAKLGLLGRVLDLMPLRRATAPASADEAADEVAGPAPPEAPGAWGLERLARAVARALVVDLAAEQGTLLHTRWRRGLSRARAEAELGRLAAFGRLARRVLAGSDPRGPRADVALDLLARLRFLAESRRRWWERVPPFRWLRRSLTVTAAARAEAAAVTRAAFPAEEDRAAADGRLDEAVDRLGAAYARDLARRERWALAGREAWAQRRLMAPVHERGVTTAAELLERDAERVVPADRLAELEAAEARRAASRERLERRASDLRAELLDPRSTEELLAAAEA